MTIIKAGLEYADYLASKLSEYFTKLNAASACPVYQSDPTLMHQVVNHRLVDQSSNYDYFVMLDSEARPVGMMNLERGTEWGSIVALYLDPSADSPENVRAFMQQAITYFRELRITKFRAEINTGEETWRAQMIEQGGQVLSTTFLVG